MNNCERLDEHQKFKELAALAERGTLSDSERLTLRHHLQVCDSCQQAYDEYALIGTQGMAFLAAVHGVSQESREWDDRPVRNQLLARVQQTEQSGTSGAKGRLVQMGSPLLPSFLPSKIAAPWTAVAVAACVLLAVAAGAYHLGGHRHVIEQHAASADQARLQDFALQKKASDELIAVQKEQLSRLQIQASISLQEVTRLQDALRATGAHSAALSAAKTETEEQLRQVSEQRDRLAVQLRDAEHSYQLVQAELTTLRNEHDRALLRTTSLESKVDDLTASARDQEQRLKDDEQYLASDRDIRELMGARKLYIADVFDVDSSSRARKPFGRVFYTQSKSLIFYAFDLDRQPGVKNAGAFQVWGERDTESGEKYHAMNLGILYKDSDANRRWVLRLDDPKQLAEIDAVFVTVEPHGGSVKPTGKPFLYALLRKEANHP